MWPTFATQKGARFELSNSPGSGPQRAGKRNAPPGAKETWETLKEMGLVVGQVLVQMSKLTNMVLMSIDSVLVLLVLTHIRARWILNLEFFPQFNARIPFAN